MNVTTFYNHWEFWAPYDPAAGYYGTKKVSFDGVNRLILVDQDETVLNAKEDIYSAWKEWTQTYDNSKFPVAISAIGGDPITDSTFVGTTYFLENGWRVQPYEGDYILEIKGNFYTREPGGNPVIPVSGVSVSLTRASITEVAIAGGVSTENRLRDIWRILGLDTANPQLLTDTTITVGDITLTINNIDRDTTRVQRS